MTIPPETPLTTTSAKTQSPPRMALSRRIRQWAFSPFPIDNKTVGFLRICLRIFLIMYQEFFRIHLAMRAAALTYTITLSLIPILALSTSILKGLGNDEQLHLTVTRFIEQLEPPVPLQEKETASGETQAEPTIPPLIVPSAVPPKISLTTHLHHAVDLIFQYVDRTNFAALGIFGVSGLIGVVILVLSSIENAMNAIWHTHKGRSFSRKIMDYLALLILLPLSLNIALAAEAILANKKIMDHIALIIPAAWMATFFIKFVPFVLIIITLMVMYLFFPHVKVKTGPALVGAVFAAIFWFITQKIYIITQIGVAGYNAIYGSFATIPLFLLWLQIGWTFILIGSSLAYAIQHHQQYSFPGEMLSPQRRLQTAFDILQIVYDNFSARRSTSPALLRSGIPQVPPTDLMEITMVLINGQLLNCNESTLEESEFLLPVTSAEKLRSSEVVQLILGNELLPSRGGQLASQAVEAACSALKSMPFSTQLPPD